MAKISPYFPKPHEVSRADDRKVISGIVYVLKTGGNGRTPLRYTDDRCDTSQSSQDGGELAEREASAPYRANQGRTEPQAARRV